MADNSSGFNSVLPGDSPTVGQSPSVRPDQATPASALDRLFTQSSPSIQPPGAAESELDRLFQTANPDQLDPDTLGLATERAGASLGNGWNRDTISALNVYGERVPYDALQQLEGGQRLIDLAVAQRQGNRGFMEALTTGSAWDFVPYAADLASTGLAIKNMVKARDTLSKLQDPAQAGSVSLQDKVYAKLFETESMRQSNQTMMGTVASIVRQAPAFALEILSSGGLFKAGSKAVSSVFKIAAKDSVESLVSASARQATQAAVANSMRASGMTREALDAGKLGLEDIVEKAIATHAPKAMEASDTAVLRQSALNTARAYVETYKNPSLWRDAKTLVADHVKSGFLSHLDTVGSDLPPTVRGALANAAAVMAIDVPIKGLLYGGLDFAVVNPLIAKAAGGDEAVTKTELGYYLSGDPELERSAKMLAFGNAIAQYGTEFSGQGFEILKDTALRGLSSAVGRPLIRHGLRAAAEAPSDFERGSMLKRVLESTYGTEEQLKASLGDLRTAAVRQAAEGGRLAQEGVSSVSEAMQRPGLVDKLTQEYLGARDKSAIGYFIASRALDKGITPQAVSRWLKAVSYDELVGELMEERYNDFLSGLFGIDGTSDQSKGVAGRLAYAMKQTVPGFQQGAAEIMAFALPICSRGLFNKAYGVLGASNLGHAADLMDSLNDMAVLSSARIERENEAVKILDVTPSDADSGSVVADTVAAMGKTRPDATRDWLNERVSRAAESLANLAPTVNTLREGRVSLPKQVAKAALKAVEMALTGNPFVAFNDPVKAAASEKLGLSGLMLLNKAASIHKFLYDSALESRIGKSVADVESGRPATEAPEALMSDPEIEAAIRPQLRAAMSTVVQSYLSSRGALTVSSDSVTSFLNAIQKDGKVDGVPTEEYRKRFLSQIEDAISGKRVVMSLDHNAATFFYQRKDSLPAAPAGDTERAMELYLNSIGVHSVTHADQVEDPSESVKNSASSPMDVGLFRAAAGGGDPASVASARLKLALQTTLGMDMASSAHLQRTLSATGDYARLFLAVNEGLLRPQFSLDGRTINVNGAQGRYRLEFSRSDTDQGVPSRVPGTGSYETMSEALAAVAALRGEGGAAPVQSESQIRFSPEQAFFTPLASNLLHAPGALDYLLGSKTYGQALLNNPMYTLTYGARDGSGMSYRQARETVAAEIALARRWVNRSSEVFASESERQAAKAAYYRALADTASDPDATEDGYETVAAKAAEELGIRRSQNPARAGEFGFMFTPAAYTYDGTVYVPLRQTGSSTAVVEDALEAAIKRDPMSFRDSRDRGQYSPAVKAFMETVYNSLSSLRDRSDSEDKKNRVAALLGMFNPGRYNVEGVSHAINAFAFMRGDSAVSGKGREGSAYYDILGEVAAEVRADTPRYYPFLASVNRLVGGRDMDGSEGSYAALQKLLSGILPKEFLDNPGQLRPVNPGEKANNPITDLASAALAVSDMAETARSGMPLSGLISRSAAEQAYEQKRYASGIRALEAGGDVRIEDLPAALMEMRGVRQEQIAALSEKRVLEMEASNPETAAEMLERVPEMAAWRDKNRTGLAQGDVAPDTGVTASMAETTLVSYPSVAIGVGERWLSRRTGVPVKATVAQVFDEWRRRDPLLTEDVREKFYRAAQEVGLVSPRRDTPPTEPAEAVSDTDFLGSMDSLFGKDEDDADGTSGEVRGIEQDGTALEDPRSGDYVEDKAAKELETSPHALLIRGILHFHLPAAQRNDQTALEALALRSSALYPRGAADPRSFASLFDRRAWTQNCKHPALADADSFDGWLKSEHAEDGDPLFEDLKDMLGALGVENAFKGLDKLKGSYGNEILTVRRTVDENGNVTGVGFYPRRQSLSSDVAESLTRTATLSKPDTEGALKILDAEASQGIKGRLGRLSAAAEKLLGRDNWISQKLNDPKVRAMINRRVGAKDRTYTQWFVTIDADGGNGLGLVGMQLRKAAYILASGDVPGAVREILRGDALYLGQADNRGGMASFLNDAAGLEPVTAAVRVGGRGRVSGVDQDMSAGQIELLNSPEFEAAFLAAMPEKARASLTPEAKASELFRARRFGLWPDGLRVFATINGIDDRGFPSYEEVVDLSKRHFDSGSGEVTYVAYYNSEKTKERLIQIPRSAIRALSGEGEPSFESVLATVSRLLGVTSVSPKRAALYLAGGASAQKDNARVALIVPEDGSALENLHGMGYIGSEDLGGYYRSQGYGDTAKVILTRSPDRDSPTLFAKGQFILADREVADGARHPAEADMHRIARGFDYVTDLDSFKESALQAKVSDGRKVFEHVLSGSTGKGLTVSMPDGTAVPLGEYLTANGVRMDRDTVNGTPVAVISFSTGLRSQYASAPAKEAKPKHNSVPVNYLTDNPHMWEFADSQSAVRRALAKREEDADLADIVASLPESVQELIRAGTPLTDPAMAAVLGPKLAGRVADQYLCTMFGQQYLNRNFTGARVVEESPGVPRRNPDGSFAVSDPYRGMELLPGHLIHDTRELSGEESARMNGARRRLAQTCANVGGITSRYGLRVNATAFGVDPSDHATLMQAVEDRVLQLKQAERASLATGDISGYLSVYKELIDGAFLDWKGDEMPSGQVLSFADLVTADGQGNPVFDRTRLYSVSEGGDNFVFLGGMLQISGRTPSKDGRRAEFAHSVAAPAYLEPADGSQRYLAISVRPDGTLGASKTAYPAGTLVPGREAVLVLTPEAKYLAGSDDDWDKSHSQRLPTDWLGREAAEVENAADAVSDPELSVGKAKKLAEDAISGLEAKAFWACIGVHRSYTRKMNPVTATPFSPGYQKEKIPALHRAPLDTPEGAGSVAESNKQVSALLRSISVKVITDLHTALALGLRFKSALAEGKSVLDKPQGAVSPFWDRGGFTVGAHPEFDETRVQTFIDFSTGIANATFDDLKEALAYRAGFKPEFLDLYLMLGYESGVRSQSEYEAFHSAFMEWEAGPVGRAITLAFNNGKYPEKYGGKRTAIQIAANRKAIQAAAGHEDPDGPSVFRLYKALSMPHRVLVDGAILGNEAVPSGGLSGYIKALPIVKTLLRLQIISSVGDVVAYKKTGLAFPDKAVQALNAAEAVSQLLFEGGKTPVVFDKGGAGSLRSLLASARRKAEDSLEAQAGSPAMSEAVRNSLDDYPEPWTREKALATGYPSAEEAAASAAVHLAAFHGALKMTPEEVNKRIRDLVSANAPEGSGKNGTTSFLEVTEAAFRALFSGYSKFRNDRSRPPNAAMDALLAPSRGNRAAFITLVGSDNTAHAGSAIREGMGRMADGTSGISDASVTLGGKAFTVSPSDFYWMLMQYTALTAGKELETTRANQSLLRAFYGPEVFSAISRYQTEVLKTDSYDGGLLTFSSIATNRAFPSKGVVDALSMDEYATGLRDPGLTDTAGAAPGRMQDLPTSPVPMKETDSAEPASARANLSSLARSVSKSMDIAGNRRLQECLVSGVETASNRSSEDMKAAMSAARILSRASGLPWASDVPGIKEAAKAANAILAAMRHPDPAVIIGTVRAMGRAAKAAGATEAVDELKAVYAELNASQTGDADRIRGLVSDPAILSRPPVMRVLMFAVASDPSFRTSSGVSTESLAARLAVKLGLDTDTGSRRITASRAESVSQAFDRWGFDKAHGNTALKERMKDPHRAAVERLKSAVFNYQARAALATLQASEPELHDRLLKAYDNAPKGTEAAEYEEYDRDEFTRGAMDNQALAEACGAVTSPSMKEPWEDAAVGYTPDRGWVQPELPFGPGITASQAASGLADLIRAADREISKGFEDREYREFLGAFYSGDNRPKRKTHDSDASVSAKAAVFLGRSPSARREAADFIDGVRKTLSETSGLGAASVPMQEALALLTSGRGVLSGDSVLRRLAGSREYGKFMEALAQRQRAAIRALTEVRKSMDSLPPEEKRRAAEALGRAEGEFFSALHLGRSVTAALRPFYSVKSPLTGETVKVPNPLRQEVEALEGQRMDAPEGVPPPAPDPVELSYTDPETGSDDPADDFHLTFVDTDAYFYGTVFPSFRGGDIRDVLFDKQILALVPDAFSASNRFEAYFGLDSEGSLRRMKTVKGLGHYLENGAWQYDDARAQEVTRFERRKLIRETSDIISGNAFSDEELELARWYGNAVYSALGNGTEGTQATAVDLHFDLPWNKGGESLVKLVSYEEAVRRRGNADSGRVYALHEALLRLHEILPAAIFKQAEAAMASAVYDGSATPGDFSAKADAALRSLQKSGFAVVRYRREEDSSGKKVRGRMFDGRFAVPVRVSEAAFLGSSAAEKLVRNGRDIEQMRLDSAVAPLKGAFERLNAGVRALGWAVNGDARLFSDIGTAAPMFKGAGAFRYFSRRTEKPPTPAYRDAVAREYDSLLHTFGRMKVQEGGRPPRMLTGSEAAAAPSFQRMFGFLRDLAPTSFTPSDDAGEVWAKIAAGQAASLGLSSESTAWDIAKKVYEISVLRLHESAWAGGTAIPTEATKAGLEAFNRRVGETAAAFGDLAVAPGASFEDVYDVTGALPQNLTAGEALALHAKQVAEMVRYRACVNQMLMTVDENGTPLVYARPGLNEADDTVPDRVWGMLARWWAESYAGTDGKGAHYDESKSGRENAARLYDEITPGLKGPGHVQDVEKGVHRYVLTEVKVPAGMSTFSGVCAMKDPAGDDTKARLNLSCGGEAAGIVSQVFALAGFGRPDAKLSSGINRALSWSKSASVMASLFFPIATAFESPVAAVGFWPTVFGLTGATSDAARWMERNKGWMAKAVGVSDVAKAPFMHDILRVIGSDDPALVQLKTYAILSGLNLADRAHNMLDTDRTVIAKDIDAVTDSVRKMYGGKAAKSLRALLEGAMEHSSELAFEYIINATKISVFAQMSARLQQKAVKAGRWWDPVRDMKKWAGYINAEVGGIDPAMYPWMTPAMQQILKCVMFSWEWTLGAWDAGGGGVLTQKWFGRTTPGNVRGFMLGRWLRMYGGVMIGLPFFMQLAINGLAKGLGSGGPDDKWLTADNEQGHSWKDFDITPLLRAMAEKPLLLIPGLPTLGDIKRKLPESVLGIIPVGSLIPGITGQEGETPTTRRRRYYMHLGKQGWEVAGWFENPSQSFLSKLSMPAQRILEGILGVTPSMGWEKPFADMGFWERWTSLDPRKSALTNLGGAFVPFSAMSMQRSPEAGAITMLGPVSKGTSKTAAEKSMAKALSNWADADSVVAIGKGRKGSWTDLASLVTEQLEALRLNGYDAKTSLKNAMSAARKPLYERVHAALPAFPSDKADTKALEEAARGLYRLDFVGRNLMKSIDAKDKAQHIRRIAEFRESSDAALREAFDNPYGIKRRSGTVNDDMLGGDVRRLLASDSLPETMLGYPVVPPDRLTFAQRMYFKANPGAAGHFELDSGKGDR